jgi:predicted RNA binding protein YcfA (HicA-like mRNA interferase family)
VKIREVIRMVEQDGWFFVRQRGSHRQYKHPTKPGTVTISGHPGDDVDPRNLASVLRQAQIERP